MRSIFALALAGAVSASSEVESAFMAYITQFGKSYSTVDEYVFRLEQFTRNHNNILEHNATESSFQLGHNQFSDWTIEEYKAILTYKPDAELYFGEEDLSNEAVANSVNWVTAGAVQAIKDQGNCGSCWAFSAVCSMESAHKIQSGKLLSFAEQQLVDCDTGSNGCNGGNKTGAFNYFASHGAMTESSYPYTAKTGTCKYSSSNTGVKSSSHTSVTANNVTAMKAAVSKQPVSVSIEADQPVFQSYKSGIMNSPLCGTQHDHATNVVGFGSSSGQEYWLMRNSWGTYWGESGYMRVAIVDGLGICGIQMSPSYPTTN